MKRACAPETPFGLFGVGLSRNSGEPSQSSEERDVGRLLLLERGIVLALQNLGILLPRDMRLQEPVQRLARFDEF